MSESTNPLLDLSGLPPFSRIAPAHVEPAVDALLAEGRATVERVSTGDEDPTWDNLASPLEAVDDRIRRCWSPVGHLHAVKDSPELRDAYNACLPKLSEYATEVGQNTALFAAYERLAAGPRFEALDPAQRKVVENALIDFRLSGVHLKEAQKSRFSANARRLSELSSRFGENVLDATQGWRRQVTRESELAGLPETVRALARHAAEQAGLDGWLLTLELPSYLPVMNHAEDGALRREMYEAYTTRASEEGPDAGRWDNGPLMEEILALRHEQARLLGFANYAERSLARKMADSTDEVLDFLHDLARRAVDVARREYGELCEFARTEHGHETMEPWDVGYFSEKLREHRYALSQETLRPYFPVTRVVPGLFEVAHRLYGLDIRRVEGVDTWAPDVAFYEIRDGGGELRGQFYLDLYARTDKRGGAWMDECSVRRRTPAGVQIPVAHLVCNFTPPVGGRPSLLTHDEVSTLFHEFGHGLHHMLTRVDYAGVSGINGVPWDAVELPSQFMENWCWERASLDLIAGHHATGEPLPDALFQRMVAARNFQSGMKMVRQLEFALFDFRLHREYEPEGGARVEALLDEVRREVAVVHPPAYNRFANSFTHIFAGGYAAGYYSYKWAEVLSSDAFSRFEEEGIFNRDTGLAFLRNILEQGGTREAMDLFVAFRGRRPSIDALLRHSGIAARPESA